MKLRRSVLTALGAVSLASVPALVHAQAGVTVAGTAYGCFFTGTTTCNPTTWSTAATTWSGLTYTGANFNGTTDTYGVAGFGGSGPLANFGFFTLDNTPYDYTGNDVNFHLHLVFTAPGSGTENFAHEDLTGSVTSAGGRVTIGYGAQSTDASPVKTVPGVGTVQLLPVNVYAGAEGITGEAGNVTVTPEPSSMALLGTGLVGLVPMFRRRKQS